MKLEDEIGQKKFASERHKALINIIYSNNWLAVRQQKFFKEFDITHQQFNILRILRGQHPKPCTINLLRERMLDKMSDASRIVERLVIKKLITRKKSETDRRAMDILISKKGLDLLSGMDEHMHRIDDLMSKITETDAKHLNFILDKLRD